MFHSSTTVKFLFILFTVYRPTIKFNVVQFRQRIHNHDIHITFNIVTLQVGMQKEIRLFHIYFCKMFYTIHLFF